MILGSQSKSKVKWFSFSKSKSKSLLNSGSKISLVSRQCERDVAYCLLFVKVSCWQCQWPGNARALWWAVLGSLCLFNILEKHTCLCLCVFFVYISHFLSIISLFCMRLSYIIKTYLIFDLVYNRLSRYFSLCHPLTLLPSHWDNVSYCSDCVRWPVSVFVAPHRLFWQSVHSGIGDDRSLLTTFVFTWWPDDLTLSTVTYGSRRTSLSVVLQLGTLYQQPFETCLHYHPVSAAVLKLNYLAGRVALLTVARSC